MTVLHKIVKLPQVSMAISFDGKCLGPLYTEYRINASYKELPRHLLDAVVSAEDKRFFFHKGFDLIALLRAFWKNLKNLSIVQGGSTITQQLSRIAILHSNKRTLKRKFLELLTAIKIERTSVKEEILEAYLNAIYLGHNIFGVKIAAWEYFGKNVSELEINESAYLAGLIRAPNRYLQAERLATQRKNKVLKLMYKNNFIILHPAVSAAVPYFCHSGLSRIFLVIPNKSEGFPTSGNDTENKYSISDALRSLPQGIHKRRGIYKT